MGRVSVSGVFILGAVLAAAGVIAALALGLPALGLNQYGRNPLDWTLRGEVSAGTLYVVGAALLASATRWIRVHQGPLHVERFSLVGIVVLGFAGLMAVSGNRTGAGMLVLGTIALIAPIVLGGWPWVRPRKDRART